jgi:predicted Zn-dependent protease
LLRFLKYLFHKPARYRFVILLLLVLLLHSSAAFAQRVPPVNIRPNRPAHLNVQYHRAETAWRSGSSLLEAKARIDRVLTELPLDAEARKLRAGIYLSMGAPEKALEDALAATRIDPEDGEAQLLVCEAAVRAGDRIIALEALSSSASNLLEGSNFHVRLSRCAENLQEYNAAEAYARTALAGDARDAKAHLQLARVFILNDEPGKATTILNRAVQSRILSTAVIRQDSLFTPILNDLQ